MKNYKSLVTVILLVVLFVILVTVGKIHANNQVTFRIETKSQYLVGEPVWVDLYVTNNGKEVATIRPLDTWWWEFKVHLVNSKGDTAKYSGYLVEGRPRPGPSITPKETYYHCFNLSEDFGTWIDGHRPPLLKILKPESYTLHVSQMGIVSNKIEFKVESPTGNEKKAYSLYLEAARYHLNVQKADELLHKYPRSLYADLTCYEIGVTYGMDNEGQTYLKYAKKLISDYPNSGFIQRVLWDTIKDKTVTQQKNELEEIIKNHPDTRAAKFAKKLLKEKFEKDQK